MTTAKTVVGVSALLLGLAAAAFAEPYALVAGSVFRPSGHTLPGAKVTLSPEGGGKRREARTDARGEFAFRVPAKAARYTVKVTAAGLKPASQTVQVQSEERVDLLFLMEAEK
ncbi:MAG: carboxypeptidase-like regulatory domain-containing protein [Bryobacteraceae bacterium]|nr:carboxypeptidase-like regulatory domain-containing protein [Bryobacteraceae bacterium]